MANEDELRASRLRHVEALQAAGVQPFSSLRLDDAAHAARMRFVALAQDETARQALPSEDEIGVDDPHYPLFGRVVARRGPFVVLRTPMGDAQALVRQDSLPAAAQAVWQQLDLGDHLWVSGPAMRTRTGAAALRCEALQHMSKALLPPPAKWHGLRDVEKRYRERYVDLFANPEVSHVFRARAAIVQALRAFLDAHAFVEVETPLLHHVRGGATARPFGTHHNALDLALYLRIAPELHLKRLLVGGLERVYELGRAFRNEGVSTRHNPEFTILEYYQAYADIELLQTQTVAMLRAAAAAVDAVHPPFAAARTVALEEDWVQVRMRESVATALRRASDLPPDAIRLPIEPEAVGEQV
ncbi:MAG: amino acid--tRNA ligase-related protein, partial [Polyangiales bacterium]